VTPRTNIAVSVKYQSVDAERRLSHWFTGGTLKTHLTTHLTSPHLTAPHSELFQ